MEFVQTTYKIPLQALTILMLPDNNSHSWACATCERVVEVMMNYLLPIICLFIQTHSLIGFNPPDNSSGDYIWKK